MVAVGDGLCKGRALGADADGIARVLDVGAVQRNAGLRQHRAPDPEPAVRTVRSATRLDRRVVQRMQLGRGHGEAGGH